MGILICLLGSYLHEEATPRGYIYTTSAIIASTYTPLWTRCSEEAAEAPPKGLAKRF